MFLAVGDVVDPALLELGAFGTLVFVFVLVIRWMLNQFQKSLQEISKTNANQTRELRRLTVVVVTMQQIMLRHDWSTVGKTIGHDDSERMETVERKYEEMHRLLEDQKSMMSVDRPTEAQGVMPHG